MDLHKLQRVNEHILVLRNLFDLISHELHRATEEKQRLLENLGMTGYAEMDCGKESDELWEGCMCGCALEDVKGNGTDRSVSPTSPLDCFESHPVTEAFDEAVVLEEGQDRSVAVHYSEDLPTPRGCACPDGTTTEVDPDLNNDFSDLYDSTRRIAEDQHNNPDSLITGFKSKVHRSTSSLNNVECDSDLEDDMKKPEHWISNTVYTATVLDMVHSEEKAVEEVKEKSSSQKAGRIVRQFLPNLYEDATVTLRSYDAAVMEKISAASRMANELKRMRIEIREREARIDILQERQLYFKATFRKEIYKREQEIAHLKETMDQATSQKFIMFCKLQSAEARIAEMERELRLQKESIQKDLVKRRSSEVSEGDNIVELDIRAQCIVRSNVQQSSNDRPHKRKDTVSDHPLQDSLSEVYKKLVEEEKRGDVLQRRLDQFEKQKKNNTSSSAPVKTTKNPKRTGSIDSQKLKLDLTHVRTNTVHKETSNSKNGLRSRHETKRPPSRVSNAKRCHS